MFNFVRIRVELWGARGSNPMLQAVAPSLTLKTNKRASERASRRDDMKLTIEQIDKKINSIEEYYNNFNMMSYEYDLKDKMYLGRLYKLKLKLLKQQASKQKG